MKHAVSWFEIPIQDLERAKKFYEVLYGVPLEQIELDEGHHVVYLPYDKKGVGGSLVSGRGYHPCEDGGIILYLNAGDDLALMLQHVEPAGGQIIKEKFAVSEHVHAAVFRDTEGNKIGLYSPN